MPHDWILPISRLSGQVLISGFLVLLLSRWRPAANPRWHRLAWGIVLVQGVMFYPISLSVTEPAWWATGAGRRGAKIDRTNPSDFVAIRILQNDDGVNQVTTNTGRGTDGSPRPPQESGLSVAGAGVVRTDNLLIGRLDMASASTVAGPATNVATRSEAANAEVTNNVPASSPMQGSVATRSVATAAADHSERGDWWRIAGAPLSVSIETILTAVWIAGLAAVAAVLAVNYVVLNLALLQCSRARLGWTKELHDLCLALGVKDRVHLEIHPSLGPFLCWTPRGYRIVVPARLWNRLSSIERNVVLHHELCHLRRGDLWKSAVARLVVVLHWFNPLAWVAARRFDESAEWSCDALMAAEVPSRMTQLASALLKAVQGDDESPLLTMSATGGQLFQRIRRLLTWNSQKDTLMQKCLWTGVLLVVAVAGSVRLQFVASSRVQGAEGGPTTAADGSIGETASPASGAGADLLPSRLAEFSRRIVTAENDTLRKFVDLMRTPTGQIVMADRAAVRAAGAESDLDAVSMWEQFVATNFDSQADSWSVKPDRSGVIAEYVQAVEAGTTDLKPIASVLQEIAASIDGKSETALVLQRFLRHEGAPAFVYAEHLRSRLHPDADDLAEQFDQHLVRTTSGSYVIRPARRKGVERRLDFIAKLGPMLGRFQKELGAWADDLSQEDELHKLFASLLSSPAFAAYLLFDHLSEEQKPTDEELDGVFWLLEEATRDTADGLELNRDSEQFQEIQRHMNRFSLIWEHRQTLDRPLHQLAERIEEKDELHSRVKAFLATDLAMMFVVKQMEYLPVSAEEAAREWLAYVVTRNNAGMYEITFESSEELRERVAEYFRQYRELRRRGRIPDEFSAKLDGRELREAMQSVLGKLLLKELIERTAARPQVDGLELWFSDHFAEKSEGLVLHDWAGGTIEEVLEDAREIEAELSKSDF